jgi:putative intracellular protease/amidase
MSDLNKVAIVVANGFEQVEVTEPKKALEQAGFKLVAPKAMTPDGNRFARPR